MANLRLLGHPVLYFTNADIFAQGVDKLNTDPIAAVITKVNDVDIETDPIVVSITTIPEGMAPDFRSNVKHRDEATGDEGFFIFPYELDQTPPEET